MSLGDGCLRRLSHIYPSSKKGSLCIKHCLKQKPYLVYKAKLLSEIFQKDIPVKDINNSGYPGCYLSVADDYLRCLYDFMTHEKRKFISSKVLNRLTPEGIAIWYMDDGSLTLHKSKDKLSYHSREIYLNTYCSFDEAETVQVFFKTKYNIDFRIAKHKEKFRLACNTSNTQKFVALVSPFIIPEMEYKIDLKYNRLCNITKFEARVPANL